MENLNSLSRVGATYFFSKPVSPGTLVSRLHEWLATPEREVEKLQAAHRLHDILSRLNLEQRLVFTLFELEGLSCDQIGAQIGVPVGTVYSRLHRARKTFLRALSRQRARYEA